MYKFSKIYHLKSSSGIKDLFESKLYILENGAEESNNVLYTPINSNSDIEMVENYLADGQVTTLFFFF